VLSSVAVAQTNDATRAGDAASTALTTGFHAAFWVGAAIAAVGVLASVVLVRRDELERVPAAEAAEPLLIAA
jgi:hypothetical protein